MLILHWLIPMESNEEQFNVLCFACYPEPIVRPALAGNGTRPGHLACALPLSYDSGATARPHSPPFHLISLVSGSKHWLRNAINDLLHRTFPPSSDEYRSMCEKVVGSLCMELYISVSLKFMLWCCFLSPAILPVGIVVAFVAVWFFTLYMIQSFQWVRICLHTSATVIENLVSMASS